MYTKTEPTTRELLEAGIAQIAQAGPERFNMSQFIGVKNEYLGPRYEYSDEQRAKLRELCNLIDSSHPEDGDVELAIEFFNNNHCGWAGCLAGHLAIANAKLTGKLVGYDEAVALAGLDMYAHCGASISVDHPFFELYEKLAYSCNVDRYTAEWICSLLLLNSKIDQLAAIGD